MILYFSGVSSMKEAELLRVAGVCHVLIDPFDLRNGESFPRVAMDSGAYRAYKRGTPLPQIPEGPWDFVVSPDVIGNPDESLEKWKEDRLKVPVWHWGEKMDLLRYYLDATDRIASPDGIVGIGGCVTLMRERSKQLWHGLQKICRTYPGRFHVFGANWLDLLMAIAPSIHSADTSKWLDAARYGEILDESMTPVKSDLPRTERCVEYAKTMNGYFNREANGQRVAA